MDTNVCIKQYLNLTYGLYDLTFDYAATTLNNALPSESYFIVKFNGRKMKNVLPTNKNINKEKILLKGIENANTLEFCTFG